MTEIGPDDQVYRMPSLGADMTEGRVIEWLVEPGDHLERGDLVAVVETDKSDIEVEVFHPCVVEEFLVELGELVGVGEPVARITMADGAAASSHPVERRQPVVSAAASGEVSRPAPSAATTARTSTTTTTAVRGRARVSPRARRLAGEHGISLDRFPDGRVVTGDDVLRAVREAGPDEDRAADEPSPATSEARVEVDRASAMRRTIARRMERAWAEIPHYHVTDTLDVTDVLQRIQVHNAELGPAERLLLPAVLNVALADAAHEVGELNGWWRDDRFVASSGVDLGIVVSLRRGGIVVPTIAGAERLDSGQMMEAMRELVDRARRGRLRVADAAEASITVSNLGEAGAASVLGVIHPPQVALIGLGGVRVEPLVVDDRVEARRVVHVSVAGDHRAHDGATASRFIQHLTRRLESLP